MDGVHDMGGMDGFGKVAPEANEPVFHEDWEGRVMAMSRAAGAAGAWNIDMGRHGIEVLAPHIYLSSSYYKKWFLRLEQMLVQRGFVGTDELEAGHALRPAKAMTRGKFEMEDVERVMQRGSFGREAPSPAQFRPPASQPLWHWRRWRPACPGRARLCWWSRPPPASLPHHHQ